jgi:hypothetical protein
MKYLVLTLSLFFSLTTFADKKKNKTKTVTEKASITPTKSETKTNAVDVTSNDGSEGLPSNHDELPAMQMDAPLFNFEVVDYKGNKLNNQNLGEGTVIVVLFNTTCGHCIDLGKELNAKLDEMPNTTVLFLTGGDLVGQIPEYMLSAEISGTNTRTYFAGISKELTETIFEYKGIPQVMIYSNEKKLQRIYHQVVKWEELIEIANK